MAKFNLLKQEITELLPKSPLKFELTHAELTLKWLLKLKPDADEALQIAALAHDIERAVTGITEKDLDDYSKIDEFKQEHAIRSADIANDLLKKHGYDEHTIDRVRNLIEKHEAGGDIDANLLMDADSIAYFDYNVPFYLERYGDKQTKGKIEFMFKRLSKEAKELVKQMTFEDNKVEKLFKEVISKLS